MFIFNRHFNRGREMLNLELPQHETQEEGKTGGHNNDRNEGSVQAHFVHQGTNNVTKVQQWF